MIRFDSEAPALRAVGSHLDLDSVAKILCRHCSPPWLPPSSATPVCVLLNLSSAGSESLKDWEPPCDQRTDSLEPHVSLVAGSPPFLLLEMSLLTLFSCPPLGFLPPSLSHLLLANQTLSFSGWGLPGSLQSSPTPPDLFSSMAVESVTMSALPSISSTSLFLSRLKIQCCLPPALPSFSGWRVSC